MMPHVDNKSQSEKRHVSSRKVEANRRNALKSTGPKTPKGKEYSRLNAITHGLCINARTNFEALQESPEEYLDLLSGLCDQYQPVGRGEELEVECIALCWWKHQRAWRHENALNLMDITGFGMKQAKEHEEINKEIHKKTEDSILILKTAQKEFHDTGKLSPELKQQITGLVPGLRQMWPANDKRAKELLGEEGMSIEKLTPQRSGELAYFAFITKLLPRLEKATEQGWINFLEAGVGQYAIPSGEALDGLLRYQAATDRSLSRSLDRLERLQKRRSGERIPTSASLRLTQ
jgi:hypothetical protein